MKKSIVLLSAIITIASCGGGKEGDKKSELLALKTQEKEIKEKIMALEKELANDSSTTDLKQKPVKLTPVVKGSFVHYIDIQGKVDAEENITVSAQMMGVVSRVNVKAGDIVKPGHVLAELDNQAMLKGVEELKTQLAFANNLYAKQKNLWDQKIGTELQYLSAKNNKEALEKKLITLNEQLEMSEIKSPISGIVDEVSIKIGQALAPGLPSVRVVNMNSLKVKGDVAESYASKVKKGNDVTIIFPDMNDTIQTKITYSAKVISPLNRTFGVVVDLDNGLEIHPNMVALLKIVDYANTEAVMVAVNMIQKAEEGDFVFISENNKAKKVRVKVGHIYNGVAEILQGLNVGDKVVSTGFQDLNEGELLKDVL